MDCCDVEQTLINQEIHTVLINRPPRSSRKRKGINLSHNYLSQIPTTQRTRIIKQFKHTRASLPLMTPQPFYTARLNKCITQIQFYQSKNRSLKNINLTPKTIKPFIPSIPQKSLKITRQTSQTHKFIKDESIKTKNQTLQKLSYQGALKSYQPLIQRSQKWSLLQPIRQIQSSHLHENKSNQRNFRASQNIQLMNSICGISGGVLTQSQEMMVRKQNSNHNNVRLQQSIVEQYSLLNNFILVKKRQLNCDFTQFLAVQKSIGFVVSLKIIDILNINVIYNQIILSRTFSNSCKVLQLYQSVVQKNRQYFLIRQYYEGYLKDKSINQQNIQQYILQILDIIDQLVKYGVIHPFLYDNLVLVKNRLKVCNLQNCISENIDCQSLIHHYKLTLREITLRLVHQTYQFKNQIDLKVCTKHLQLLVLKQIPFSDLKKQISCLSVY